jgi:hypothetical protein
MTIHAMTIANSEKVVPGACFLNKPKITLQLFWDSQWQNLDLFSRFCLHAPQVCFSLRTRISVSLRFPVLAMGLLDPSIFILTPAKLFN